MEKDRTTEWRKNDRGRNRKTRRERQNFRRDVRKKTEMFTMRKGIFATE